MTKEETLSNLKAYLDGDMGIGNIIPLRSVLESAIKYLEPSLPSELDEACQQISKYCYDGFYSGYEESHRIAARMGAEWMAGQGITLEGRASRKYEKGLAGFVSWVLFDQQKAAHLLVNQGEEADVILQIRKK